jgi:hypothetical protein
MPGLEFVFAARWFIEGLSWVMLAFVTCGLVYETWPPARESALKFTGSSLDESPESWLARVAEIEALVSDTVAHLPAERRHVLHEVLHQLHHLRCL